MFKPDGPIARILGAIFDQLMLNMFYTVFCLPVFTIGAATAALYSVQFGIAEKKGKPVMGGFLDAFKDNFLPATGIFLILAGLGTLLLLAARILWILGYLSLTPVLAVAALAAAVFGTTAAWAFPLQARYRQKLLTQLHNAYQLALSRLPISLCMLAVNLLPVAVIPFLPEALFSGYIFFIMFMAAALTSLVNSRLFLAALKNTQ